MPLPEKSRERYELVYKTFKEWCENRRLNLDVNENVVLGYFTELAKVKKPSSLWATYSMLRKTVEVHEGIDISKFSTLCALLRKLNVGYEAKKSSIFTAADIERFVDEAPMDLLPHKVALIIGISGACRSDELLKMKTTDLDFFENKIIITIPNIQSFKPRTFIITNPQWINAINQYMALRKNIELERLLVQLRFGKATKQPFGHNAIGQFPKKIAAFLKLKNPETYTGHCYRRTAAILLAANGGDILQLKKLGGWKTNAIPENYIESVLGAQMKTARMLAGFTGQASEKGAVDGPSTSNNQDVNKEIESILLPPAQLEDLKDTINVKNEDLSDESLIKKEITDEDNEESNLMEEEETNSVSCTGSTRINDEFSTFSDHVATQLRLLPLEAALKLEIKIQELIFRERIAQATQQRNDL